MTQILTLLKNLFKIAKLLSVDDSGDLRFAMVSTMGKNQKMLLFSPYGLMHNPPLNSLTLAWSQQGQESNCIGMADDPKSRTLKDLKIGEVAMGNYLTGHHILFDEAGTCTLLTDDLNIIVNQTCTLTADQIDIQAANDITIAAKNLFIDVENDTSISSGTAEIESASTLDLTAVNVDLASTSMQHNGVNIGGNHIHSQGLDSSGDTEQDTGVPH